MRLYLDTNVIMDFFLDRRASANTLFMNTFKCIYTIVISNVVLKELKFQKVDVDNLFKMLESADKLEILKTTTAELVLADLMSETHHNDALHYLLAKRAGVECLVTSNIKDFGSFTDINVMRPDDLC